MTARLVCLSGTGATGKTAVIQALMQTHPERFTYFPSVTRAFYAANGIKNEIAFSTETDVAKKFDFQSRLYQFYCTELRKALDACTTPWLLADRAAFDHAAYTLYGAGESLTKERYFEVLKGLEDFIRLNPVVFLMPFPVHWDETASEDGFRARLFSKDLTIDSYIRKLASDLRGLGAEIITDLFGHSDTVDSRATALLTLLSTKG